MREWAASHGKAVRQKNMRQKTTKFKAGTLPLNMYRTTHLSSEKITSESTETELETYALDYR